MGELHAFHDKMMMKKKVREDRRTLSRRAFEPCPRRDLTERLRASQRHSPAAVPAHSLACKRLISVFLQPAYARQYHHIVAVRWIFRLSAGRLHSMLQTAALLFLAALTRGGEHLLPGTVF